MAKRISHTENIEKIKQFSPLHVNVSIIICVASVKI